MVTMQFLLLLLCLAPTQQVISEGAEANKMILKDGNGPCEGHIQIYHKSKWGYVGNTHWDNHTEEVVCRSAHCGTPASTKDTFRPSDTLVWLDELQCGGNESDLWKCKFPGWNVSIYRPDHIKTIKCSDEIQISLDRFKCAGAVQYKISGRNQRKGYICADNWGEEEAKLLCKNLNCGTMKEIPKHQMVPEDFRNSENMMIECFDIKKLDNLWQCAKQVSEKCSKPAAVVCTDHDRLQLRGNGSNACHGQLEREENGSWNNKSSVRGSPDVWCQQMHCGTNASYNENTKQLKCADTVEVVLRDNGKPTKCYGEVHITVNNSTHPVCATEWTEKNAEVVCKELNCGRVVAPTDTSPRSSNRRGIMDNLNCTGNEASLWHCPAKRDNKPFQCSSFAYVVCAGSIDVKLKDGTSDCAGRMEVHYKGQWQRVSKVGWTDSSSDIVCEELKCGTKRRNVPEEFSQGSGPSLTVFCQPGTSQLSDCIIDSRSQSGEEKAVTITCEGHRVIFLMGEKSCSGMVGIEQGSKTYWLSGSNKTWNQDSANTVCRQMRCGEALHQAFVSNDLGKEVWDKSVICSSTAKSLFKCQKMTQPSDHNATIAIVKCSGETTVNLTNKCWGTVNACVDGECGGVCGDTWTDAKSRMLCKNLDCGDQILHGNNPPTASAVIFKSLHTTNNTNNLSQCNFVRYDEKDTTCNQKPAYVVCSGSVETRINASRYKCSGNVEVSYEGQWLPVCMDALQDDKTRNAICEELKCGHSGKTVNYFGLGQPHVISQIKCSGSDVKSLTACDITSKEDVCKLGGLRCSNWSKIEVKFYEACRGDVFVYSEGTKNAVSIKGWTEYEGELLCQDLKCGSLKSNKSITSNYYSDRSFSCAGVSNAKNIWECEKTSPSSQEQQLFIECQDEPKVTLSGKCGGELRINNISVCNSTWNKMYAHLVCKEQDCGNAVFVDATIPETNANVPYHHVSCEDYHGRLGQCSTFQGACSGAPVSVYCTDNVRFDTTEKCGGQVQVNYRNKWEPVSSEGFSDAIKEKLCRRLGCDGKSTEGRRSEKPLYVSTAMKCTEEYEDLGYCVSSDSQRNVRPAEIYCNGYVRKEEIKETHSPVPVVPIILGVGFLLVLVILMVVFVRVYVVKKAKIPINNKSRMLPREEAEFESGDYEDVTSKAHEMEEFSHSGFRSEAAVIMESDARSNSSLPYDDIDEAVGAQLLTSQDLTAGPSGDNYLREPALDHSSDGVTYEVDDPEENYDDIEAVPEITQTQAQVHDSPQTKPESVTVAAPDLVLGDDDYLVPGHVG